MRTNSISLRLNYSSSWNNKIIPGRNYTNNFVLCKFKISEYLNRFFLDSNLSKILMNSKFKLYFINKNIVLINVYIYIFKYADKFCMKNKKNKLNVSLLNNFISIYWIKNILSKINFILLKDLKKIVNNKIFKINFILVKKIYFDASLASKYITNKLLNKFKLEKVITDLKKDIVTDKNKSGIIVYCSGRFDRKERASSEIYSEGKISLTTLGNKVTYSQNNVILKYGICGIKVWVLN